MDHGKAGSPSGEVGEVIRSAVQAARQAAADAKAQKAASKADQAAAKANQAAAKAGDLQQPPASGGVPTTAPAVIWDGPTDIPPQAMQAIYSTFTFIAVLVLGSQFLRIVARRFDKRAQALAVPAPDLTPQIRQLQESVDTLAIEIERISEGQRFTAKLMAERLAAPALVEGKQQG
jgi:sRNA-binding protein